MATLKLLSTPSSAYPGASHHVGSPGGYEVWHFHAEDVSKKLRLSIAFHDGFASHPDYIRQYAAYRRRPTRNTPPTPRDFPCLQMHLYEDNKLLAASTALFFPGSFRAEPEGLLALASNRAQWNQNEISVSIPPLQNSFSATLTFRSVLEAAQDKSFAIVTTADSEHHWLASRPLCQVEGTIRIGDRKISLSGLGQHDHFHGTAPLLCLVSHSMWGCVLFPRAAVMFHIADDRVLALVADESGCHPVAGTQPFGIQWKSSLLGTATYPSTIHFGDRIIFRSPRVLAKSSDQLQLLFDAYVDGEQTNGWLELTRRNKNLPFVSTDADTK